MEIEASTESSLLQFTKPSLTKWTSSPLTPEEFPVPKDEVLRLTLPPPWLVTVPVEPVEVTQAGFPGSPIYKNMREFAPKSAEVCICPEMSKAIEEVVMFQLEITSWAGKLAADMKPSRAISRRAIE